ncbi:MAG: D-alanyl-D-alanine carboxypeptidase family protein [Bacillus sp. (in: Bacteria)]|nr:D-alanyl-D-alanine carboxypeptidase family protein [Bacillus sp. (in: firmicutes)]
MLKIRSIFLLLIVISAALAGCSGKNYFTQTDEKLTKQPIEETENSPANLDKNTDNLQSGTSVQVISKPEVIPVLVNKSNKLPESYSPPDLIYPDIPFTFEMKIDKRKMRAEAAFAIEKLFAGAQQLNVNLLGVSAYRSHSTQTTLFNNYVNKDGYEAARTYSALPGTSEHETGLAIDVTGGNGKCAAEACFAETLEAKWLQKHAAEYGFIIRYPEGKDSITGYVYEPWHLRYVGITIAKDIMNRNITLEEYLNATPVNN